MSESFTLHSRYLASLMGHSIKGTTPVKPFEGINWERIFTLAQFHNVSALIFPCLRSLDVPKDVYDKFIYVNHRLLAREARQELEAQYIFSALQSKGIEFIKLKGIVIKNMYPMPHMRTQSDVDICMTKENREKTRSVMESMGYKLDSTIDYHDEYSKDDFFIYEIHSDIMSKRSYLYPLFVNPFEKVVPDKSNPEQLVLSNEYFYLNLVIHLYKHFVSEGCGLRLFSDLYIFRRTCEHLDTAFITNTLNEYGLLEFHNTILKLNGCFFEGNDYDEDLEKIADFIFRSGEYGNSELKKLSWLSSSKSAKLTFSDKFCYFMRNWFPGVKTMKRRHPILKKAPYLLPVFWIRRVLYTLFFKRSALKEQRNEIRRLNSNKLKEAKYIRNLAGIK